MAKSIKKIKNNPQTKNVETPSKKLKITKNGIIEIDVIKEEKKTKSKEKYIKVAVTESRARFTEIGEMIHRKEIKWVRFITENNIGVHEFLILI